MIDGIGVFDLVVAVLLPTLALCVLLNRDVFRAIVLFIVFGLLMALAWSRLQAPDVALAEAAIGAGVTGVLFMHALRRLDTFPSRQSVQQCLGAPKGSPLDTEDSSKRHLSLPHLTLVAGALLIGWHLLSITYTVPAQLERLADTVVGALPRSGLQNPVTAVLLNFRGYDTLLEIAVLLLAVLGVWSLSEAAERTPGTLGSVSGPVPIMLAQFVVPLAVLIGGYLLWIGADAPGGAFQAGAVLAGAWLLLFLVGTPASVTTPERWVRPLLVIGFAVFLSVAAGMSVVSGSLLEYPPAWAKEWILLIESALTISIACILVFLVTGSPRSATPTAQPQFLPDGTEERE